MEWKKVGGKSLTREGLELQSRRAERDGSKGTGIVPCRGKIFLFIRQGSESILLASYQREAEGKGKQRGGGINTDPAQKNKHRCPHIMVRTRGKEGKGQSRGEGMASPYLQPVWVLVVSSLASLYFLHSHFCPQVRDPRKRVSLVSVSLVSVSLSAPPTFPAKSHPPPPLHFTDRNLFGCFFYFILELEVG